MVLASLLHIRVHGNASLAPSRLRTGHLTACSPLAVCRVPTTYDTGAGTLTVRHTPEHDTVQYAYFAPYTQEQHRRLIATMQVGWLVHGWAGLMNLSFHGRQGT